MRAAIIGTILALAGCADGERYVPPDAAADVRTDAGCPRGLTRCDGECVDVLSSLDHCGDCDSVCDFARAGGPPLCSAGTCTHGDPCWDPKKLCGDACVDVRSDDSNCGECANRCETDEGFACVEGACRCAGGLDVCDGVCTDLMIDPNHCGGCGDGCDESVWPGWHEVYCEAGTCVHGPLMDCDGAVVDPRSDDGHCGDCGVACDTDAGYGCVAGTCQCVAAPCNCPPLTLATAAELAATPRADENIELLALALGDSLVADSGDYTRLGADLTKIRAIEPAVAQIGYYPAHDGKTLWLTVDLKTYESMNVLGTYDAWDCLNSALVVTKTGYVQGPPSYLAILHFEGNYNLPLLAAEYAKLPGVIDARPEACIGDGSTICVTKGAGDTWHYVIIAGSGDCPSGCIYTVGYYFTTSPSGVVSAQGSWDSQGGDPAPSWWLPYRCHPCS